MRSSRLLFLTAGLSLAASLSAQVVLPPMPGTLGVRSERPTLPPDVAEVKLSAPKRDISDWRITVDYDVKADLSAAKGLAFDFYFDFPWDDALLFSGFTLYVKSGAGWYTGNLNDRALSPGRWHHIEMKKEAFPTVEGKPSDWRDVCCLRLSLPFGAARERAAQATFEICNLCVVPSRPDVLVVGGRKHPYAPQFAAALEKIGVESRLVEEAELSAESLKSVGLVALPWTKTLTDESSRLLQAFVAGGGKLLVCGAYPESVCRLMGVRRVGDWYVRAAPPEEKITGFAKIGEGVPLQPAFAGQESWQTALLEPVGEGRAIANWTRADGTPSTRVAILKTPTGLAIGHIWFGAGEGRDELLAALVGDVSEKCRARCREFIHQSESRRALLAQWARTLPPKDGERRLAWCHSERGMNNRTWDESVRFMKESHFTDLIVNMAWGGYAFYRSEVTGVHPSVKAEGDALESCLAACRRYGVKCHAWQVSCRVGDQIEKTRLEEFERSGRLQVGTDGKVYTRFGYWFCPSHPENRREIRDVMTELVRKGVDGVHFDYIRYQGDDGCYCDRCRSQFEASLGRKVENWPDDVRGAGKLKPAWRDFRSGLISDIVRETSAAVHAIRPEAEVSAAVFRNPRPGNFAQVAGQDWPRWCAEGWLDFVCPMDYCESSEMFRETIAPQRAFAGKAKIYPGIGLANWPTDGWSVRRLGEQIMHCRELGFGGWTLFELNAKDIVGVMAAHADGLLR